VEESCVHSAGSRNREKGTGLLPNRSPVLSRNMVVVGEPAAGQSKPSFSLLPHSSAGFGPRALFSGAWLWLFLVFSSPLADAWAAAVPQRGGGFHTAAEHPSAFSASGEGCPRGRRSVGNFSAATAVLPVPGRFRLRPRLHVPYYATTPFFMLSLGELSPRMPRLQLWTQPSVPMRRRLRRRLPKSKNNWVYPLSFHLECLLLYHFHASPASSALLQLPLRLAVRSFLLRLKSFSAAKYIESF